MISITKDAAQKMLEIATEEELEGHHIRVNIIPGGCAGFQFDLFFENDEISENDVAFKSNGIDIVTSQLFYLYLENTEIDYVDTDFSGGFKFNNDTFSSKCGCGKSYGF